MDTARLFESDRSQAVQLPQEYQFEGTEVYIKKMGDAVVLLPKENSWEPLLVGIGLFSSDFMEERNQTYTQIR